MFAAALDAFNCLAVAAQLLIRNEFDWERTNERVFALLREGIVHKERSSALPASYWSYFEWMKLRQYDDNGLQNAAAKDDDLHLGKYVNKAGKGMEGVS